MKLGILGAGDVAKTLAVALSTNHQVMISSRQREKHEEFLRRYPDIVFGNYQKTAEHGDIIINALPGDASLPVLTTLNLALRQKILIDLANPLDFSNDNFELSIANSSSLGEEIQRALPDTKVVKTLNTVTARLMVQANRINAPHDMFICGNDHDAKQTVKDLLKDDFGWQIIHDLGDINGARAMEQMLHLWLKLWQQLGHTMFNVHIQS